MRTLSTTELAVQDQVKASNREHFKKVNTGEFAHYEADFTPVYPIRYEGSFGGPNAWRL